MLTEIRPRSSFDEDDDVLGRPGTRIHVCSKIITG